MKKVLVGLALALTLSACGGIQKAADAVAGSTQATLTQAESVREYVNENTSLDWSVIPDSLIDKLGTEICGIAGADLDQQEFNAILGVTTADLHVSDDDAMNVMAALFTAYCPNMTIDGQAF
jgi:hypothetical protein